MPSPAEQFTFKIWAVVTMHLRMNQGGLVANRKNKSSTTKRGAVFCILRLSIYKITLAGKMVLATNKTILCYIYSMAGLTICSLSGDITKDEFQHFQLEKSNYAADSKGAIPSCWRDTMRVYFNDLSSSGSKYHHP